MLAYMNKFCWSPSADIFYDILHGFLWQSLYKRFKNWHLRLCKRNNVKASATRVFFALYFLFTVMSFCWCSHKRRKLIKLLRRYVVMSLCRKCEPGLNTPPGWQNAKARYKRTFLCIVNVRSVFLRGLSTVPVLCKSILDWMVIFFQNFWGVLCFWFVLGFQSVLCFAYVRSR